MPKCLTTGSNSKRYTLVLRGTKMRKYIYCKAEDEWPWISVLGKPHASPKAAEETLAVSWEEFKMLLKINFTLLGI